ncbi:hypothetical protein LY28_00961 [Ruminiclostridium sufflavum DSM 19573]|uniref:Uncharacterized protein n=1 Tax=Ruminiclostridium sufflavum DSM 19573 TaxID=1121337 RepID=A0A318XPQ3_9FIRM|nr:hypothetical protein [Ruminiclostridium sufflavum]PYG89138.1 hypothetical protein LY28_00961 [Ruminiclostridium sufflavum DSM 19573]
MKQIIITVIMLAIALILIIGVIVPIFEHAGNAGYTAVFRGGTVISRISQILR